MVPARLRRSGPFAAVAGRSAGPVLGVGRVRLSGTVPSGKGFLADLRAIWLIGDSTASLNGEDLGAPGPLPEQPRLGDFWVPQRGVFAVADAFFEPMRDGELPRVTAG